jgi:hypothetical protein
MLYVREAVAGVLSPLVVRSDRRFAAQLRKFAFTEYYTYLDISSVAERQSDPELRAAMQRHARDEFVHYQIFQEWARRIDPLASGDIGDPAAGAGLDARSVQWAVEQRAAPNRRLDSLSKYMQYLVISESRALLQFRLYRLFNLRDARIRKMLPPILADEARHVRYSLDHALRQARRTPGRSALELGKVLGYILVQDCVDLLRVVETVGSTIATSLLYFFLVTPYAWFTRSIGVTRRARLRTWKPAGLQELDQAFWRAE